MADEAKLYGSHPVDEVAAIDSKDDGGWLLIRPRQSDGLQESRRRVVTNEDLGAGLPGFNETQGAADADVLRPSGNVEPEEIVRGDF
jgi:hypothetical protein